MEKKSVPKKNIDPILVDVRNPNFNYERLNKFGTVNLAHVPEAAPPRFVILKRALIGIFGLLLVGVVLFVLLLVNNLRTIKASVADTSSSIMKNFLASATALKNLEPQAASAYLEKNKEALGNINSMVRNGVGQTIFDVVGNIVPVVQQGMGFLGKITSLNLQFLQLSQGLQDLQTNGFGYFVHDGKSLIAALSSLHTLIQQINTETLDIKNTTSNLKNLSSSFQSVDTAIGGEYLKYSAELYSWDSALGSLLAWFQAPGDHHIVLLFQNPSEIRPGGGFVGSYADITVSGGQMTNIDVRDIYDPDGQLDLKVIPPEQLQGVTRNWGARDANWFFDFPTSAKTIVHFLEASKMYSDRNETFDMAIALNINVVQSLLDVTGPIPLPEYGITITSDNFLPEVQREVEAGADKKAGQPKKILKVLAPILLQKLNDLSSEGRNQLFQKIKEAVQKKDIMYYAKDATLSDFLTSHNLDGSVYSLPDNFWGSYLAVVNANVAGGKTDAFIGESVSAKVDLDTNGNTFTSVNITRTHSGNTQKDPWYRVVNKDFLQVFTEPGTSLVSIQGNDARTVNSTLEYTRSSYTTNPDLAATEKEVYLTNFKAWQRNEFGKNVFAAWLQTPAGQSKTMQLRYQTSYTNLPALAPGQVYTFIFERQSGVQNSLHLVINAPFKYYWAESKSSVFTYDTNDPDKRILLTLTLEAQPTRQE